MSKHQGIRTAATPCLHTRRRLTPSRPATVSPDLVAAKGLQIQVTDGLPWLGLKAVPGGYQSIITLLQLQQADGAEGFTTPHDEPRHILECGAQLRLCAYTPGGGRRDPWNDFGTGPRNLLILTLLPPRLPAPGQGPRTHPLWPCLLARGPPASLQEACDGQGIATNRS